MWHSRLLLSSEITYTDTAIGNHFTDCRSIKHVHVSPSPAAFIWLLVFSRRRYSTMSVGTVQGRAHTQIDESELGENKNDDEENQASSRVHLKLSFSLPLSYCLETPQSEPCNPNEETGSHVSSV